jgi:Flp pilus assembly protein TadD
MLLLLENQRPQATEKLSKATQLRPLEVAWRFDLATALAALGKIDEARDHASFCLRMEPDNERYKLFYKKLIRNALTSQQ